MRTRFSHHARTLGITQAPFAQQSPALQHERQHVRRLPHAAARLHSRDMPRKQGDAGRHTRAQATRASTARAAAGRRRPLAAHRTPPALWPRERCILCTKPGEPRCYDQAAAALKLAGPCPEKPRNNLEKPETTHEKEKKGGTSATPRQGGGGWQPTLGVPPVPPPAAAGATGDPPTPP